MKRFLKLMMICHIVLRVCSAMADASPSSSCNCSGLIHQKFISSQLHQASVNALAPAVPESSPKGHRPPRLLSGLPIWAALTALLASMGISGEIGSISLALLISGILVFLISRHRQSGQNISGSSTPQTLLPEAAIGDIPAGFPVVSFLHDATNTFIRLHNAIDRNDQAYIRAYTTPEMYAEITTQIQKRGMAAQKIAIIAINAELLGVNIEGDYSVATVRFTGQLRQNNGPAIDVDELWYVQEIFLDDKSGWLLAKIHRMDVQ